MKCLSVRPPWAGCIIYCGKTHENRTWSTKFRGRVAIHASAYPGPGDLYNGLELYKRISGKAIDTVEEANWWGITVCAPGAILGTVEIVGCVQESNSHWFVGPNGFVLANPIPLRSPIPILGKLGFWDLPADIEARIVAELGVAV